LLRRLEGSGRTGLKRGQAQEVKKGLFRSLAKQVGIDSHSAIIQRPPVGVKPISQPSVRAEEAASFWRSSRSTSPAPSSRPGGGLPANGCEAAAWNVI